jgi:hypothetical protein
MLEGRHPQFLHRNAEKVLTVSCRPELFSEMSPSSFLAVGFFLEIKEFWPFPNDANGVMPCQRFSLPPT